MISNNYDENYDENYDKSYNKNDKNLIILLHKKIAFFKDIVQNTIIFVKQNNKLDILGISELSLCVDNLQDISKKINIIENKLNNDIIIKTDYLINELQIVNNELSVIMKNYGTQNLEELLLICFGNTKVFDNRIQEMKYELLKKYFHPISYKIINKNVDSNNKKTTNKQVKFDNFYVNDTIKNLDCSDINLSYKQFHVKVYGLKIYIYNYVCKKGIIIYGIMDDIIIDFLNNKYILDKIDSINKNAPDTLDILHDERFCQFIQSLTIKDFLMYNDNLDYYNKYIGYNTKLNNIKQKTISQNIKDFISDDTFAKRTTLIILLVNSTNYENLYLAYLLYDLLSNDTNGNIDTEEQKMLLDSFPWYIKKIFKKAMKKTIQYTNQLSNFDINKIPLEQQICLLKANDCVKEKAMMKLKEIKSKSEDSGSKARQYLDGLLKIPFYIYKSEPILNLMEIIKNDFNNIYRKYDFKKIYTEIVNKDNYTSLEIIKYINMLKQNILSIICAGTDKKSFLENILLNNEKKKILEISYGLNKILTNSGILSECDDKHVKKTKSYIKYNIIDSLTECIKNGLILDVIKIFETDIKNINDFHFNLLLDILDIEKNIEKIFDYMKNVKTILDKSVHGHDKAKKQIERIISQWINGEQKGNCFGFEGSPGVGKTTLAKGLSECLKDENGISRPFSLIMMGGDANSSHLVGHSYTYVGSTWGQIVQILIDKKCMNPIILIDEVDKISRTEHGKEITGILTHLLDPTQNDSFQDKYFSGIDLDLSKVLFILSYNDAELIDKILLDRIHRIKFDSLSIDDKIVICNKHLLPEIYKNIGLEDMIYFPEETLKFVIEEYTLEPGVRKLKEKLFEIVGEINLNILKNIRTNYEIPFTITIEDIKNDYFKDKREIKIQKIHNENVNYMINGMYANSYNQGGVLAFQACFTPANYFLEIILTGNQKEVMKEGMILSKNLAWNLTDFNTQTKIIKKYNNAKNNCIYGININAVGLSIPKDGPSATSTICVLIYALLNNLKIKHFFAMTGEVSLDGKITEIGGLEYKIIGSIKNGVKEIVFPKENERDFNKFYEKYKEKDIIKDILFHSVSTIQEVFDLILIK
jgi:ATP-dependent Lon protease